MNGRIALFATLAVTSLSAFGALGETTHVVSKGHTLHSIARRYKVSEEAIIDANDLKNPKSLKPGTELVIPGKGDPAKKKGKKVGRDKGEKNPHRAKGEDDAVRSSTDEGSRTAKLNLKEKDLFASAPPRGKHAKAPKTPHIVTAVRLGEEFKIRVLDKHGKIPAKAVKDFEKLMRSGDATHHTAPRLIALLGLVSDHFGSRPLEVVSGFRPFTPAQYTPHSKHNSGRALDFKVQGVPNEELRDFCKTFKNVGVGYYPNSTFVHLDVREQPAFWVDYSKPGEAPQYNATNPDGEEDDGGDVEVEADEAQGSKKNGDHGVSKDMASKDLKESAKPAVHRGQDHSEPSEDESTTKEMP